MNINIAPRVTGTPRHDNLTEWLADLDQLGITIGALGDARAKIAHAAHLHDAARQRPGQLVDDTRSVALSLAAADISVDDAIATITGTPSCAAVVDQVRATLTRAASEAEQAAVAAFRAVGDQVLAAIDVEERRISATAAKLAPKVDGIDTDRDAITAGGRTASAWAELTTLAERLDRAQHLADQVRTLGLDPTHQPTMRPDGDELHYARPWYLPDPVERANLGHPIRHLLAELAAEPCELSFGQWAAADETIAAGWQAHMETRQAAEQARVDEQARILNENLASLREHAERRNAGAA